MRLHSLSYLFLTCAALGGCVSTEEQQKLDVQACASYGFQTGTNEFATCMKDTAQRRQADQAANQRQQSLNDTIAQQAQRDRDAQAAAQNARDSAAREADVQRMMNSPNPSFIPPSASDTSGITTPTVPSIDTSNMNCTRTQTANAGSLSCSN
jgi:septal ring factor EnvC (AmiA/AmiB activator)